MPDFLGMSDEDIMKMTGPEPVTSDPKPEPVVTTEAVTDTVVEEPPVVAEPEVVGEPKEQPQVTEAPEVEPQTEQAPKEPDVAKSDTPVVETAINYENEYKQVMAPFKANGEMIQLKSAKEAIQLMQMGANYTHKMQQLAPKTKLLRMLEANGLDENRLSFLIDIDKKNPEAIKKLVKDSGIDPMDIDTTKEPEYREGNHKVSDTETKFYGILDDLKSSPEGSETLGVINTWDQASKEKLWDNAEVMQVIHEQRENGIYDRIATEVKRLKTLGEIPANTEFLTAYQHVGKMLHESGGFADLQKPAVVEQPKPNPIAVRTAVKPVAKSNPKVDAAAPSRATSSQAAPLVNFLAMDDDAFMKSALPR